jgi:hypothetical protein
MAKKDTSFVVPDEIIMQKIYFIRNQKVMLDSDLAELYGVETRRLKEPLNGTKNASLNVICLN